MFFPPFPPKPHPIDRRCSRRSPSTRCEQRRTAQSAGEFFYSFHHGGWIWGDDRMVSKLLRNEHRAPYTWPFCPWCGGSLPSLESAIESLGDTDPATGEDGG